MVQAGIDYFLDNLKLRKGYLIRMYGDRWSHMASITSLIHDPCTTYR